MSFDVGMTQPLIADRRPLPFPRAFRSLAACVASTCRLMVRHRISQPTVHVGDVLCFSDGSCGRVYRETVVQGAATDNPAVLVVEFRLRGVRGWGHNLFRAESLLNTPLFVGFPGFVSKLWVAHDEHNVYRGVYEWNDGTLADAYARALWWVLALVSTRGSIHYVVLPGLRRDDALATPSVMTRDDGDAAADWWRITRVSRAITTTKGALT